MKTLIRRCFAGLGLLALAVLPAAADALRVPAFTAYIEPDFEAARVSPRSGISGWNDAQQSVVWYGQFPTAGKVTCAVALRLPAGTNAQWRLTVAGQAHTAQGTGAGRELTTVGFGEFTVPGDGAYQRIELTALNPAGQPNGEPESLVLDGPAAVGAHFNLKSRRNAASVHLAYPVPAGTNVAAFYCEMAGVDEPLYTYYMACGWHRGYFGMQINSPTERRVIFSVWDSGNEGVSRSRVDPTNRVVLLAKGAGVDAGDFGNEGTGGHSHLVYNWKTGATQRFLVTAQPTNGTYTIYSGYFFQPERKQWELISSWRAPKEGGWLHGLYSFSENFGGDNGHLRRKARYGNQWIRTPEGVWVELTGATFSHDPTGKSDRLDRFMGVEEGRFFLSHGGFGPGFTKYGELFHRPATGQPPVDLVNFVPPAGLPPGSR